VAEGGGLLNRYRTLKFYRGFESPTLRHLTTQVVDLKRKSHIIIDLKPYRACAPSAWRAPRSPLYTPFTLQNGKYLTTGKLLFLLLSI